MKIIVVSIVTLILIVLVLFLFSALKLSSWCSRIEELNDMYDIMEGDDVYEYG